MGQTTGPAVDEGQILYLEPDDEIPSVVRRIREAEASRVVMVAPGRTRATSSAIGLRLLARHAGDVGRHLVLVADPSARALAAEAGISAFASIGEAQRAAAPSSGTTDAAGTSPESPGPGASPALPAPRASIRVVRGEHDTAHGLAVATRAPSGPEAGRPPAPRVGRIEETQALPVAAPAPARAARTRSGALRRRQVAAGVALLLVVAAVAAAILPGATITLVPTLAEISPRSYTMSLAATADSGSVQASATGRATGTYTDSTPAKGSVTFYNYSDASVRVPKGTVVAAGSVQFTTDSDVVVAASGFFVAGSANVTVTAKVPGPDGNVAAHAISTIADKQLDRKLRSSGFILERRVDNANPTGGGATTTGPQITQKDVDAAKAAVTVALGDALQQQLASEADRIYATDSTSDQVQVDVPPGLVGTKDQQTFQLSGTLSYQRWYVTRHDLVAASEGQLEADTAGRPASSTVVASSVLATPTEVRLEGGRLAVTASVQGAAMPALDISQLRARVAGLSAADARRALASIGAARVTFWPPWVDSVPRLPFRIEIAVQPPAPTQASPAPGSSP